VLVVHPDAGLRADVADALRDRGYAVTTAPRAACPRGRPAVVVIDHRALPCSTPARILGLVPDHDDAAILAAFTAGAADVLAGPLRAAELASRVAVLARRTLGPPPLRVGPIAVDTEGRRVSLAGRPVELTRREYELLTRLATAPGRVFTKQELLRDVWADPSPSASRRLDTQVARLRRRLGPHRTLLVTVWGVGYRLGGR
jgi:DNA-binding response OmpR family regulator